MKPIERIIVDRLNPYCGESSCEKFLKPNEIIIKVYPDRLEVFCKKHGTGIPSQKIRSNCLVIIQRFSNQKTLVNSRTRNPS